MVADTLFISWIHYLISDNASTIDMFKAYKAEIETQLEEIKVVRFNWEVS